MAAVANDGRVVSLDTRIADLEREIGDLDRRCTRFARLTIAMIGLGIVLCVVGALREGHGDSIGFFVAGILVVFIGAALCGSPWSSTSDQIQKERLRLNTLRSCVELPRQLEAPNDAV